MGIAQRTSFVRSDNDYLPAFFNRSRWFVLLFDVMGCRWALRVMAGIVLCSLLFLLYILEPGRIFRIAVRRQYLNLEYSIDYLILGKCYLEAPFCIGSNSCLARLPYCIVVFDKLVLVGVC